MPRFTPLVSFVLVVILCIFDIAQGAEFSLPREQHGADALHVVSRPSSPIRIRSTASSSDAWAGSQGGEGDKAPSGEDIYIHVAKVGNDAWSGTRNLPNADGTDGPVNSLYVAQRLARIKLAGMATAGRHRSVHVLIGPGNYYLHEPLLFTPADSGTAMAPVIYEAKIPGTVNISGGVVLNERPSNGNGRSRFFDTSASKLNVNDRTAGGQLFVNGRRAILARQPDEGRHWFVKKPVPLTSEPVGEVGREAFEMYPEAKSWISQLTPEEKRRAVVHVMQAWSAGQHRIRESYNSAAGVLHLKPRSPWAYLEFGTSQRYFIENVAKALDAPREWLWTEHGIEYLSAPDERNKQLHVVMPVLEKLILIRGDLASRNWVENLEFRNLSFSHTRYKYPEEGFFDVQAAINIGAAIEVDGARNIVIENCTVSQTGGYGVWFREKVQDSRVSRSIFTDLGAGGIKLGQEGQVVSDPKASSRNTATDNRIGKTGQIFPGAVGIWVGQSFDNLIAHNFIYNTTYSGISVGWTWGYGEMKSGRNRIANNLLVNIGQGQMSDLGAIYTLGISQGTEVTGNVIREVRGYPDYGPGAWGIYGDEGTSGTLVKNNVVIGTDSGGYHLHYGRSNTLEANLFGRGDQTEISLTRSDAMGMQLQAQDNFLISVANEPFSTLAKAPDVSYQRNKVSARLANGSLDISRCGGGCTTVSAGLKTTSNPLGIVLMNGDAISNALLRETVANAGPRNNRNFAVFAPVKVKLPAAELAPSNSIEPDIKEAELGSQPFGFQYYPRGDAQSIAVTGDEKAPNDRCLQFLDGPVFKNRYEPFAFLKLHHKSGSTVGEFSIVVDSNSNFIYEWRDNDNPYLVGPSMRITASGVEVNKKIVAPVKVGEWFSFRISSDLDRPRGFWKLEMRNAAGQVNVVNDLPYGSKGWKSLDWVGFISDAMVVSRSCIAGVRITNDRVKKP